MVPRVLFATCSSYVRDKADMLLDVHKNRRLFRDGEKGYKGVMEVEEGDCKPIASHRQNDSSINMGSDESHFNVLLTARDEVTRQCPQTTTLLKRMEKSKIEQGPSAYQPITPYRYATHAHKKVRDKKAQPSRIIIIAVIGVFRSHGNGSFRFPILNRPKTGLIKRLFLFLASS